MKMKTSDSKSFTTSPSHHPHSRHHSQVEQDDKSIIEIATLLVDSVSNTLCSQIINGDLIVDDTQLPLQISKQLTNDSQIKFQPKTIDLDEHRRLIRRFMRQNNKMMKQRKMRSLQLSQRTIQQQQRNQSRLKLQRQKSLENRRKQIEKRMQDKKQLMKQISKSILQASERVSDVRKKKFLYQQKQQQFHKKFTLPKLEQQKLILQKKRSLRVPINITEIYNHERQYEKLKIDKEINREATLKLMQVKDTIYNPPQFIPQSYKMAQKQQNIKKQQQEMKKKQLQINQIRKKQYIKQLDEVRQKQKQTYLELSRSKEKKNKKNQSQVKNIAILNRQQRNVIGDDYLKDLLKNNRKIATLRKLKSIQIQKSRTERRMKSQKQIQDDKTQRSKEIQQLRSKKIQQILSSQKMSSKEKQERLKYEMKKLEQQLKIKQKQQKNDDIQSLNETAGAMINSIQAKLAFLTCKTEK